MVKSVERRIAPRAPMGTKIKWKIVGSSQWHEDSSQNVSSTGMMIRTGESVKPGVAVKLSFNLPNLKFQDPMIVEAEVVRQVERNGRHIGLGLRFLTLKSNNL
ncbi:MAG: PilZ domain-containing protein [Desulfobulbaceae bacterium]|nr:PilZ domain-containing protein [Desulfobulbaceae bacterium]